MSSNHHIRKEHDCLNCGKEVNGKYCSNCGQLNREAQMSVHDLLHDLLHSIWHFDGKFFVTMKSLITKPGFLSKEFISGKRVKYLPPVQMYLFTAAVFYFLLYTFFLLPPKENEKLDAKEKINLEERIKINLIDSTSKLTSIEEYHKKQSLLPKEKQDGFIKKYIQELQIRVNGKFEKDSKGTFFELIDHFIHSFSSLFFVSLPLIALWLNLIFFKRKNYNFVSHFIFITHNYIFNYVVILLNLILHSLASIKGLGFLDYIALILYWIPVYGFLSMKNFYKLSKTQTFWKFFIALLGSLFIFILLIMIYILLSFVSLK